MFEAILAAIVFTACVVLLVRLTLGASRRQRLDAALRSAAALARHLPASLWHWRGSRRRKERAKAIAKEAIRRAGERDERGEWDGNVYKPKSFQKPPRDKMH